jgi:hypothetical protein
LEEWIEEDRNATKESLLERIKQLPQPPLVQAPVHQLVENNGNGGGAAAAAAAGDEGGGQDGQPEQQQEQQDQPWSLPADEIVLQRIQDVHDAVMTRLVAFPKDIARRLEEWLIAERLLLCPTTSLPADTWIKKKVGMIRYSLKQKWEEEHPLPDGCYVALKEWLGKDIETPAQVLLDEIKIVLEPSATRIVPVRRDLLEKDWKSPQKGRATTLRLTKGRR